MKFLVVLSLVFCSCSFSPKNQSTPKKNSLNFFLFKDASGEYILKRELIRTKTKIQLRQSLFLSSNQNQPLEKSISISDFGSVNSKNGKIMATRPMASQFWIWFEKQKYFSQTKLNLKTKKLDILLKSPEEKWNKKYSVNFPKGTKFCWFNQIPECIQKLFALERKSNIPQNFTIVWDSFPYYNEQYQGLAGNIFSQATVKYDGEFEGTYRFAVASENQIIFYHYNKDYEFEKMFWVSQGITLIKSNLE